MRAPVACSIAFVALSLQAATGGGYDYMAWALKGDLSGALQGLAAGAEPETRDLDRSFRARFVERSDGLPLDTIGDPVVRATAAAYQDYWRDALLRPGEGPALEARLRQSVASVLVEAGLGQKRLPDAELSGTIEEQLRQRGYRVLLGRTPPLLEFMLWKENERVVYTVELTDGTQEVTVFFMVGFVSRGWAHFATFGRASAGGWAKLEGLYAVKESYDLESEKFAVSYLKHEARHFADYERFPKLESADLEYRAKLTELVYAEETLQRLLESFHRNAALVANAPHSVASWHVARGVSRKLLDGSWPQHAAALTALPAVSVRSAAKQLLEEHTQQLEALGPETRGTLAASVQ